ncbi:nitrate ABC transporter permease [Anaerocolumna cellulosilytica]|uniref:Nitrate ABC transporter permease n=1 Tax=Anaerocolumna cellulosilytica TaxID=433286 RepID=A0A6S6RDG1_9FIRM|nr:ABC transporter permease subunit [Anaerocolumna cellulosilytica]MBB5195838.1 NitT/TauT family transport system permease protein [Anaerocolumna cellulosilytica]BCJ96848.1 nitrate ABC transporter permease [Anaerocolumna cellulosilytica]
MRKKISSILHAIRYKIFAAVFWILFWQLLSMAVNKSILLASPATTVMAFVDLVYKAVFWKSIFFSFAKIMTGFSMAVGVGILFAVLAWKFLLIKELVNPFMKVVQATPVASFIILALLWISSRNLSILTSFLMTVPVIYTNVLHGIRSTDEKLLEMAKVFRINPLRKIRYLYIPAVAPYFFTASTVGLGLCLKAGIAAEVIAIPKNSIGEQLYTAKLYLMTGELFAWTFVIIVISVITEKLFTVAFARVLKAVT